MDLDRTALDNALESFTESGVSGNSRMNLVVSMTSYPARIGVAHYALFSVMSQSLKPDAVILWLTEEEFPGKEKDVPEEVLRLRDNGLTIGWTENLRSYTKLVPSLRAYPDSVIVTADDDLFYLNGWLERLHADYENNGRRTMVHAHRAHRIALDDRMLPRPYADWTPAKQNLPGASFLNFATGFGGVLYPPGALHPDAVDAAKFLALAPHADDVWFWAMAVLNGTMVRLIDTFLTLYPGLNPRDLPHNLWTYNILEGGNTVQMANVLEAYPEIAVNLMAEQKMLRRRGGRS